MRISVITCQLKAPTKMFFLLFPVKYVVCSAINYKFSLEYRICLNACIVKMFLRVRTFAFMHLLSDSSIYCPLITLVFLLSDCSSSRCFSDYLVLPEPFTP